jgi:hypothetical protein
MQQLREKKELTMFHHRRFKPINSTATLEVQFLKNSSKKKEKEDAKKRSSGDFIALTNGVQIPPRPPYDSLNNFSKIHLIHLKVCLIPSPQSLTRCARAYQI